MRGADPGQPLEPFLEMGASPSARHDSGVGGSVELPNEEQEQDAFAWTRVHTCGPRPGLALPPRPGDGLAKFTTGNGPFPRT
jgi:hypothetical protein